jgi:hypothetical protein
MKYFFLILLLWFSFQYTYSQSVKVLEKFSKHEKIKFSAIELVNNSANVPISSTVANIEGRAKKSESGTIEKLFYEMRNTANNLGANAYRIDSIADKKAAFTIYITLYRLSKAELTVAQKPHELNTIYIFGEFDKFLGKAKMVLNGTTHHIEPLHYISHTLEQKEETILYTISPRGDDLKLRGYKDRPAQYIKIGKTLSNSSSSFNVGVVGSPSLGVAGNITNLELDLGQFLIQVLYLTE